MEYVEELKKYIPVDIYGKCGDYPCANKSGTFPCDYKVATNYKFYIAFENSICVDYVTEKFFNNLLLPVVPIVMVRLYLVYFVNKLQISKYVHKIISILGFQGGANYETISPNHSFINVANFESPKHLASYLVYLDNHPVSRKIYVSIYFHLYSKGLKFSGKVFRIFCLEENSFNYSKISHLCIVRNATSRPHRAKIILKSS